MNNVSEKARNQDRIKIEPRYDDHHKSYYVDTNGLLKGEWYDYKEFLGPNNETMFCFYYNHFLDWIEINEYGLFYNIFSCRKYDVVLKLSEDIYICEKNGRFGLLDKNEKMILHVCYQDIKYVCGVPSIFLVSTEIGVFLFNLDKQKQSEVYEDIARSSYGYFTFKLNDKYGLIDNEGNVILKPEYEKSNEQLSIQFKNYYFSFYVNNNLFYDKFSINEFDLCIKVTLLMQGYFYITKKNSKYGLYNSYLHCVSEPRLDDIVIYEYHHSLFCRTHYLIPEGGFVDIIFLIGIENHSYSLFNIQNCQCIIKDCQEMQYITIDRDKVSIKYKKNGRIGYVTFAGIIVSEDDYDTIEATHHMYIVSKEGKYGAITGEGKIWAPCIFDNIEWKGNGFGNLVAIKDGEELVLNPKPEAYIDDDSDYENQRPSYGRYAGSYAQDEMGYSDDDIDTIFEGDPDAYWNID